MIPFDAGRLEALMAERGVDVVFATTRHNVRYLTGGYYNHFFARVTRTAQGQYLAGVGVPRDLSAAFHVGGQQEAEAIDRFGGMWIEDRLAAVPGRGMTVGVAVQAAAALRKRGLGSGTIGLELPFLPADAMAALRHELPSATFVDATPLLGELRAVKRPEELDRLRDVHRLTAEAIHATMTEAESGRSTRELAAAVERGIGARGAAFVYCLTNVGPSLVRAPGEERWDSGQPLHIDAGAELADYVSDICRMGSIGEAPAEAMAMYAACLEAQERLRAQLAEGVACADVQRLGETLIGATRWGQDGRFAAHGLGMVSHEPPQVASSVTRPLEAGMVLSLETEFRRADIGHVKFEDSVVITRTGCEGLGDIAKEWCVAGG